VEGLNVADSTLRPQAENYLKRMRQAADTKKLYEAALADIKNEEWPDAQQQLQEVVDRKGLMSAEAKKKLADVAAAQKAVVTFNQTLQTGAFRNAKSQLDNMPWPKTREKLLQDLRSAERSQQKDLRSRAEALQTSSDLAGLARLQDELHIFQSRIEDPDVDKWAKELDEWLTKNQQKLRNEQGDKAAFEALVTEFNATKQKGDLIRMKNEVLPKFQKMAKGSGAYRDQAQTYVTSTIPAAMDGMIKTLGPGKVLVPPIVCTGEQSAAVAPVNPQGMTCAKLDADVSVQWLEMPMVEMPSSANQPGKLPYTLHLIVTVDPSGKVKVEKDGNADKDFLKKAKEAAKTWKATIPKSGGTPVSVSFPLAITFAK